MTIMGGAACGGPASEQSAATHTAERFAQALANGDGSSACELLTSRAQASVTGSTDETCEDAIVSIDESPGPASGVEVWGDAAQVRVGSDTIFLLRLQDGWRVDAAGCIAQQSGPYDCDVES